MVPKTSFSMADVREVAKLNVAALIKLDVFGGCFIASGTQLFGFNDTAQILIKHSYKGPSTKKSNSLDNKCFGSVT